MKLKVALSGAGQKVNFEIARPGQKETIPITIEPRREETDEVPRIGVAQETSLTLAEPPVGKPVGISPPPKPADFGLKSGDTLVAVGPEGTEPEKVDNAEALRAKLATHRSVPLVHVFERRSKAVKGKDAQAGGGQGCHSAEPCGGLWVPPDERADLQHPGQLSRVEGRVPGRRSDRQSRRQVRL